MAVPTVNNPLAASDAQTKTVTLAGYAPTVGVNAKLAVIAGFEDNTDRKIASITYAGQALARAVGSSMDNRAFWNEVEIWYLDDPLSFAASGDVVVETNFHADEISFICETLLGIKRGAPDAIKVIAGNASPVGGSILPTDNESIIISGVLSNIVTGVDFTATSPHVKDLEYDAPTTVIASGHVDVVTPDNTTVEFTVTGSVVRLPMVLAAWGRAIESAAGKTFGREQVKALMRPEKTDTVAEVS